MSILEAQKLGRQLFGRKDYKAALEAFTEAIELSEEVDAGLFDNRAATSEKLGDLTAALRDGKAMIHLDKSDARGYLRTAKILQLMGKRDVALGIYKYGLKHVRSGDPHCELLQRMCEREVARGNNSVRADPLLVFPVEISQMIASQLDHVSLVRCLRVSRPWNDFLSSSTSLWTDMDFSGATKAVGKTAFRACLRRSRGLATRATLARLVRDDGELLTLLTKNCPKLDHLEIRNSFTGGSLVRAAPFAKNLTSILISEAGRVTMDTVEVLLETCATNHRRMDWPKPLSNLKRLWLLANRDGLLPGLNLAGLFAMAPNIQDLVVADWQQASWYWETIPFPMLSGLTRLTLRNTSILHFPPLPLSIRHLELSDLGTMKFEDNSRENIATATLCNLEGLSLNKIAHFPAADLLVLLAPSTGKLQRLRISDCANITGADIAYLASAGAMSSVHDLALCGLDLDDDCIELLAPRAPQLTRLDLASTRVSGIAVRALVARKEARPIEWLGLDGCAGVGADAVELARAAGVVVQHSLEKGRAKGTKGTKVRLA